MFRDGYVASFRYDKLAEEVIKNNNLEFPKEFKEQKDWHECFIVVKDKEKEDDLIAIWFANLEEGYFYNMDGSLTEKAPNYFMVDEDDLSIWG